MIEVSQGANSDRVILNGDGTVHYRPAADFVGTDRFTYTISDGNGGTASAEVTVTVSRSNQVPVGTDDVVDTDTGMAVTISVLENDSDADEDVLTVSEVIQGDHGSVEINEDSTIRYTPDANFVGTDRFTYTISDGNGGTASAGVIVTVKPVNHLGDFDHDSQIGTQDLLLFSSRFGAKQGDGHYSPEFDLDNDGEITFLDFIQFSNLAQKRNEDIPLTKPVAGQILEDVSSRVGLYAVPNRPVYDERFVVKAALKGESHLAAYGVELWYDDRAVEFLGVIPPLGEESLFGILKQEPGRIWIGGSSLKGTSKEGITLARFQFRLISKRTTGPLASITELIVEDNRGRIRRVAARDDLELRPSNFVLLPNYPNPFNPSTAIPYALSETSEVRLTVYNTLGQEVRVLVNAVQGPGVYRVEWDSRDALGQSLSSGVYFYRPEAGKNVAVRKMVFAK